MKPSRSLLLAALWLPALGSPLFAQDARLVPSPPLLEAFARKAAEAEKNRAAVVIGKEGWLFLASELRFLSFGKFWGGEAAKVSRAPKPDLADPLVAIVDFQQQLKARGIALLVVPVPPKATVHADQIIETQSPWAAAAPLRAFLAELTKAGVEVLDLDFAAAGLQEQPSGLSEHARTGSSLEPFCRTDTHWSPAGCQEASTKIAEWIAQKLGAPPATQNLQSQEVDFEIVGDLVALLPKGTPPPAKEKLRARRISGVDGKAIEPDPASPVLLMGDSHTLVFHDFLGERAGLLDQLALARGAAPDLIGTRGSGSTAVRLSLYRKSIKDPAYLAKKKVVVWCFTAREFTESDQGWAKLPISK